MAKQLAALLGGVDIQRLAELVRQHGRGKDTVLAHITPREAEMLKANGGSGTINPMTGLPEFQSEFDYAYGETATPEMAAEMPSTFTTYTPEGFSYEGLPQATSGFQMAEQPAPLEISPTFRPSMDYGQGISGLETAAYDRAIQSQPQLQAPQAAQERDYAQMAKEGAKQLLTTREGLGLTTAALAGLQARRGFQQAQKIRQELGQLGQAQRAIGQEQVAAGQAGQVTPAQRQQLEALAAQQRQQLAQRGLTSGTAAQQMQARQVELQQRMANDLLQQGLSNLGVADAATRQAIIAGYQADAATSDALMQALMSSAQLSAGQPSQTPYRQTTTLPPANPTPGKG
jgi:hypothetical protein